MWEGKGARVEAPWVIKIAIIKVISQDGLFTRPSVFRSYMLLYSRIYVCVYVYIYIYFSTGGFQPRKFFGIWEIRERWRGRRIFDRGGIRMCFEDGRGDGWVLFGAASTLWRGRGIREGLAEEGIDRMGMVERSELLRGWEHPAGKKRGYLEKKIKIDRLDPLPLWSLVFPFLVIFYWFV